jgi:LacI family transcriptional regulator
VISTRKCVEVRTRVGKLAKIFVTLELFEFGRGLIRGIAKYSRVNGPWEIHLQEPKYRKTQITEEWIKKHSFNGIIAHSVEQDMVREMCKTKLPIVLIAGSHKPPLGSYNVCTDDATIGKMGAKHLLERGFRNFAFCGFKDLFWSSDRCKRFCEEVTKEGFEVSSFNIDLMYSENMLDDDKSDFVIWLKSLPKPVGLMACNDDASLLILNACRLANISVPEQMAIVGVDNDELICDLASPPLSSIMLNTETAGYEAASLLNKLMYGKKIKKPSILVSPVNVKTRQSSDILAIEDSSVAAALRFIRHNAKSAIYVKDVTRVACASRRVLEKRFRKLLHHSILEEIRRARINEACMMIADTNSSIKEISQNLNFSNGRELSRNFSREKHMTPHEYRTLLRKH